MTRSDQAQLLQRKAAQDLAVLDRLLDDAAIDDETLGYHAQQAAVAPRSVCLCGRGKRVGWQVRALDLTGHAPALHASPISQGRYHY
jgi:hypothetical protein